LDLNEFYLDYGVEYGQSSDPSVDEDDQRTRGRTGYTTLPRACCLQELIKDFHPIIEDKESPKLKVTSYPWALTKDVAAVTLESSSTHPFRKAGLCYIQFYPSCKNQFECSACYPYPERDDSGVALALDDHTLTALYSKVGRPIPDRSICRGSWRHSGRRLSTALASHAHQSFHMRMEIRMNRDLQADVIKEITNRRRSRRTEGDSELGCPFYIYSTRIINNFVTASTQVIARLYQEVISLSPDGQLGIDHQKIAIQLFKLQKVMYSASNLRKDNYLWKDKIRIKYDMGKELDDEPKDELGLGLSKTIEKYGYGYPLHGLIDWRMLGFISAEIAEAFPHPSRALMNLEARVKDRQRLKTLFEEVDFIIGRLRMEKDYEVQNVQLNWLAIRLVFQYHIDITVEIIRSPYQYPNKQQHNLQRPDEEIEEEDVYIQGERDINV
jgi:hypothetical protein